MHRVVNLVATVINTGQIKDEIRQKLTEYDLFDNQVNDGQNDDERSTIGVSADFNFATEANNFHGWLKQYITDRREIFINARTRIHDCLHAAGQNQPCQIGDVWELT